MRVEYVYFNGLSGYTTSYKIEGNKLTVTVERILSDRKASKEVILDDDTLRRISLVIDELASFSENAKMEKDPLIMDAGISVSGETRDGKVFDTNNFNAHILTGRINEIINERHPELEREIDGLFVLLKGREIRSIDSPFSPQVKNKEERKDKFREMYPHFYDESGVMKDSVARFLDNLIKEHYLKEIESYNDEKDHRIAM